MLVRATPGLEPGENAKLSLSDIKLRVLPDGGEQRLRKLIPTIHNEMIRAGMEIPVLIDDDGKVVDLGEPMDEAIGRYFLAQNPDHGTWQNAYATKLEAMQRYTGLTGNVRWYVDSAKDIVQTAKDTPGEIKSIADDWKSALSDLKRDMDQGSESNIERVRLNQIRTGAGRPVQATVVERTATDQKVSGATVWNLVFLITDGGATRRIEHTEALHDTWPASLQVGQTDTVFLDPDNPDTVVLGYNHGINI